MNGKSETKNSVTSFPYQAETTSEDKTLKKDEKLTSVATAAVSGALAIDVKESTSRVSKSAQPEKSSDLPKAAEATTTSKTGRTLGTVTTGARLYKGLHRLHRGSSRLIGVLAPEWDINDIEEDDEEISDYSDGDEENEEEYDSDNDSDRESHYKAVSNDVGQTGSKEFANAAVANIGVLTTLSVQVNARETAPKVTTGKETQPKKATITRKREISEIDPEVASPEQPVNAATEGRDLKKRYTDWSRYVIWTIILLFPLLFIGTYLNLLIHPMLTSIAIGILVACRNRRTVGSKYGNGTNQALEVAVSVWPIIFAGIVAQSLRAYATYRVERGVRLMVSHPNLMPFSY
jgi:hypothetical protein